MKCLSEVASVAPANSGGSNRRELWSRSILDGLASIVPVQIPLQQRIVGRVDLSTLFALGHLRVVITTSDLDVESLGPELALRDIAVVVDGRDLRAQDVVAAGNILGDLNVLAILVVVENGVSAPVAGLLFGGSVGVAALTVVDQRALVDLKEFELGLVDVLAVAVAGCEVGCGPAVVAAVPALLTLLACALMVPVEGHFGASWGLGSVGRGAGILVGNLWDVKSANILKIV